MWKKRSKIDSKWLRLNIGLTSLTLTSTSIHEVKTASNTWPLAVRLVPGISDDNHMMAPGRQTLGRYHGLLLNSYAPLKQSTHHVTIKQWWNMVELIVSINIYESRTAVWSDIFQMFRNSSRTPTSIAWPLSSIAWPPPKKTSQSLAMPLKCHPGTCIYENCMRPWAVAPIDKPNVEVSQGLKSAQKKPCDEPQNCCKFWMWITHFRSYMLYYVIVCSYIGFWRIAVCFDFAILNKYKQQKHAWIYREHLYGNDLIGSFFYTSSLQSVCSFESEGDTLHLWWVWSCLFFVV